jgi:SAM-dependent methyltransferase
MKIVPLRVLDAGAGTGFWTEVLRSWYEEQGAAPLFTALDLSEQALSRIKTRHPEIETIRADLSMIDPTSFRERFGLVASFYCLHHLPRISDFLNGLRFAARSVAPRGVFLMMDPVLSQPYSPFYRAAFSSFDGNGMPRSLHLIDDALEREGLDRIALIPAVSFILNGSIEARSRLAFTLTSRLWGLLQRAYRSEHMTRSLRGALACADVFLKRHALAFSSSLLAYQKRP